MSGRTLASLIAGFGTGFLQSEKQKAEKARQDKLDANAQTVFDQGQSDRASEQAYQAGAAAIAGAGIDPTVKPQTTPQQIPAASGINLPQVNYTGQDPSTQQLSVPAAQAVADASAPAMAAASTATAPITPTPATQSAPVAMAADPSSIQPVANVPANPAASGINITASDNPLATQSQPDNTPASTTGAASKPLWQVKEDLAKYAILSSNPTHRVQGFQDLIDSQKMKSEAIKDDVLEAYQKNDDGASLLALANNHKELPYNNLSTEDSQDGKSFTLSGTNTATGKDFSQTIQLPLGMTKPQWLAQELISRSSADLLMNHIADQVKQARDAKDDTRKDNKDAMDTKVSQATLDNAALQLKEGNLKLESLPESIKLDLQAKKASTAASFASANASNASAEKSRADANKTDDVKLPPEAKMMQYLQDQGVAKTKQEAYDMVYKNTDQNLVIQSAMAALKENPFMDPREAVTAAKKVVDVTRNPNSPSSGQTTKPTAINWGTK